MELTGNSASRWEQVSNKIGDIAFETDKQRDQLEKLVAELVGLVDHIRHNQEVLTELSGVVYKEVFREESMMLNDDSDESTATIAASSPSTSPQDNTPQDAKTKHGGRPTSKKHISRKAQASSQAQKAAQESSQSAPTKDTTPDEEQSQSTLQDAQHHE